MTRSDGLVTAAGDVTAGCCRDVIALKLIDGVTAMGSRVEPLTTVWTTVGLLVGEAVGIVMMGRMGTGDMVMGSEERRPPPRLVMLAAG